MAKKKKTRQQKIIADLRRQVYASQDHPVSPVIKEEKTENHIPVILKSNIPVKKAEIFTNTYPYLVKDLRKTAILSTAIVLGQFLLLFILKNHIFTINGLIY